MESKDIKSPPLSLKNVKMPVRERDDSHLGTILSMPISEIPSLQDTLDATTQPSKKEKLTDMITQGNKYEGRGIKTRGWIGRSPTRGKERHQLTQECGSKCFLLPEEEKFPICASPKLNNGVSKCEIDCGGVQSAKIRAAQWGYKDVEAKADILLEKCNQDGLINFLTKN